MNTTTSPNLYDAVPDVLFSNVDYALFTIMLGCSALIGIYFGCYHHQNTVDAYAFGGKKMQIFPVAMSLIASNTSGIAVMAVPADIYKFGGNYVWICLAIIFSSILSCYVFLPVFLKLQVSSTYEYLNKRFDKKIRTLASFLYIISVFLFNPIVIYIPALAFAQATGLNIYIVTPVVCLICIFYTTVGGLKAVVWTDTLQTLAIAISLVIVFVMGIISAGGFSAIIQTSIEGQRLDIFDFDVNPTVRDGFWTLAVGATFNWCTQICINQATVQRLLAVSSLNRARKTMLICCIGIVGVKLLSSFTGLILYTKYKNCDPLSSKKISRHDQLLPYYVMDVTGSIPGVPGIFIAGVFSAGLSTLSTTLNTLSFTIYEDFMSPFLGDKTEKQKSNIMKLIAAITGVLSTFLVFVVEHMGGILPLTVSFMSVAGGPLLGLFTLGLIFPMANSKGALYGGIGGFLFGCWVIFWQHWYKSRGLMRSFAKPLSTAGCSAFVNATTILEVPLDIEEPFVLYRISFWYFILLITVVVVIIGLIVSWITNTKESHVHPDLISPLGHLIFPQNRKNFNLKNYSTVDGALELVANGYNKK